MRANHTLRRRLAEAICAHVNEMAQVDAAVTLGLHQSDVSLLRRGIVQRFSAERLLAILARLGYDVEIRISRAGRPRPTPIVPRLRVLSVDSFGREAELEGTIAPRARNRSFYSEEMADG